MSTSNRPEEHIGTIGPAYSGRDRWLGRRPILSDEQVAYLVAMQPRVIEAYRALQEMRDLARAWDRPLHVLRKYINGRGPARFVQLRAGGRPMKRRGPRRKATT